MLKKGKENFGNYKNALDTLACEYTFKEVEEENIVLKVSTIPTDGTLLKDIPMDVTPIENIPNLISNEISTINNQAYSLNLSSLPVGMYILDVQQGEKHEQQKILKYE